MFEFKARVLIMFIIILCLAMLFRLTEVVTPKSENKTQLSNMSEEECIEFIKSRGVEIPNDLNNENLGEFVKDIISKVEENPERPFFISYTVTSEFVENIRDVVNEYYEEN